MAPGSDSAPGPASRFGRAGAEVSGGLPGRALAPRSGVEQPGTGQGVSRCPRRAPAARSAGGALEPKLFASLVALGEAGKG